MFEYEKNALEDKLKCLSKKYQDQDLEYQKCKSEKDRLDNYIDIISNLFNSVIILIILVSSLVFSIINVVETFIPILLVALTGLDIYAIVGIKKVLKEQYSEFLHKKRLYCEREQLEVKLQSVVNRKKEIEKEIIECNNEIDEINNMQEESEIALLTEEEPYLEINDRIYFSDNISKEIAYNEESKKLIKKI